MAQVEPLRGRPRVEFDERDRRTLITPEGVDLGLRVGEASERAAAFLIDAVILIVGLIVLTLVCVLAVVGMHGQAAEPVAVIWVLGSFIARSLYFIGFELGPRGATPGKRMMKLRVAARNGGRLTANAVFARNLMRELEVFVPLTFLGTQAEQVGAWMNALGVIWCGVFVFFPLFNRDRLRVGDLVAGTWVVKAPAYKLLPDLAERSQHQRGRFQFTQAQLDAYGIKELQVLEDVLRTGQARTQGAVAERIRRKIGWVMLPEEGEREFLDAYYAALRGRLETRLLMGRRRKDKFDVG